MRSLFLVILLAVSALAPSWAEDSRAVSIAQLRRQLTALLARDQGDPGVAEAVASIQALLVDVTGAVSVKDYGAVGNGTTNDTVAIDAALAASSTIFLPAGTYYYAGTATGKFCFGPGKLVTTSGGSTPYRNIRYRMGTSAWLSSEASWLGLVNVDYGSDNGTRFYLVPKAAVATGVGGTLKVFGDPYHDGASYRDLGIYFSADQASDNGYNGQGVFWVNSKVSGAPYTDANPDIAFSFQDGSQIGGRFVRIVNGFGTYCCFVMGPGDPTVAPLVGTVRAEMQGDLGFQNAKLLRWVRADGLTADATIGLNASDQLEAKVGGGTLWTLNSDASMRMSGVIRKSHATVADNATTLAMSNYDSATIGNGSATSIDTISGAGAAGREITLIFGNSNTTLVHDANKIVLQGGVNLNPNGNDVITFVSASSSKWVEKSRSLNP